MVSKSTLSKSTLSKNTLTVAGALRGLRALGLTFALLTAAVPAKAGFADAAPAPDVSAFTAGTVMDIARSLAARPYEAPPDIGTESDANATYDAYRDIRFRRDLSIWRDDRIAFQLHVLPSGWLFKQPVFLYLVDNGVARRFKPDAGLFSFGEKASPLPVDAEVSLSGFRITGPMNAPDVFDEIIVFQGASYFRAVSRGQLYGTSARGLAINTAGSEGEEFPFFRAYWVEKPTRGARQIVVHALLDSPSVTGAYRFVVTPGEVTSVDVDHTLFPRRTVKNFGIAPLTSMHLKSPVDAMRVGDFRPRVHDADGLAMVNGRDERLWRPLTNPRRLQVSAFQDSDPQGFGLIQRTRSFHDFQDLEARYHKRPSVWIQPVTPFGSGDVVLVEIPTEEEIHDNIVAYWQPADALKAGKPRRFAYRILWPELSPARRAGPWVETTHSGPALGQNRTKGKVRFVVDYAADRALTGSEVPDARLTASAGEVGDVVVQRNPESGGIRVSFLFDPKKARTAELRLSLDRQNKRTPEVWLYRWISDQ